jgi:hypothetical protein
LRVVNVEPFKVVEEHVAFNLPPEVRNKPFKDRLKAG